MATETDYAWAAGFTDGEGCVSVRFHRRVYPNIQLILVQKVIDPLYRMQGIFETNMKIGEVRRSNRRNTYYRLTFSGKTAVKVLQLMLPYLTIKKDVADAAISLFFSPRKKEMDLDFRREMVDKIHWINTGRWAAAETKSRGHESGSDSPVCNDGKVAEDGRNDRPLHGVVQ